jgi:hypothetical protein
MSSGQTHKVQVRALAVEDHVALADWIGEGLAALLHDRLREAAVTAPAAGDRETCTEAAAHAAQVAESLSRHG